MILKTIFVLALVVLVPVPATGEVDFQSTEIAPGLHLIEGTGGFAGGNIALSVGEDGVFLIDDSLYPLHEKLLASIAAITERKVDWVINTHVHGDHVGANAILAERGAEIVAHDHVRDRLLNDGVPSRTGRVAAPKDMLPTVTFNDRMTFHLNGLAAQVWHVEHAHTDGDALIHIPALNVIHAGDTFFNGMFPFIDLESGGSLDGMIEAQQQVLDLADASTKIIPGHGPLANRSDLLASVEMLRLVRARVRERIDSGQSEDDVAAEMKLTEYAETWSWGFVPVERMVRTAYRSVAGS